MMLKIKSLFVFGFLALLVNGVEAQNDRRDCPQSALFPRLICDEYPRMLDDAEIPVRVYTKGSQSDLDRTFVVVHNNEQKGLNAVKEALAADGMNGRLVEVFSNYKEGYKLNPGEIQARNQRRYLYFGNGDYCVDPNRIYSEKGIGENLKICKQIPENKMLAIKNFGVALLDIVTQNGKHQFIVGVHNNTNEGGLSLNSYMETSNEATRKDARTAVGVFSANNHDGKEIVDTDDFILVSDISLFVKVSQFEKKFNIALQENKKYLDLHPEMDDGSMSIYFGKKAPKVIAGKTIPFLYVNIEAEGKENTEGKQKDKQKEAIQLVMKMNL